jgi:competence protein ComEC
MLWIIFSGSVLWYALKPSGVRLGVIYSSVVSISFCIGYVHAAVATFSTHSFIGYYDRPVSVEGVIDSDSDQRGDRTLYRVRVVAIDGMPVTGKLLLTDTGYNTFAYGDGIVAEGELSKPEPFVTENGKLFPYDVWLAREGVTALMRYPDRVLLVSSQQTVRGYLYGVRARLIQGIAHALPEPNASLAAGLLLGAQHSLGDEITEAFQVTGLSHIIVLSGYNMTIIADVVIRVLGYVWMAGALPIAALMIVVFALMVGGSATVVRAATMALLAVVARATGRTYGAPRALTIAAAGMALHSPLVVLYDPGFQLSCMATLSLVLWGAWFEEKLKLFDRVPTVRTIAASTLAAQVGVLPLVAYHIGSVSLIAPLANVVALPMVPVAMATSFGAGVFGQVVPSLAPLAGIGAFIATEYIFAVAAALTHVPLASVHVPSLHPLLIAGLYACIGIVTIRIWNLTHNR